MNEPACVARWVLCAVVAFTMGGASSAFAIDQDVDGVEPPEDCNDGLATAKPSALEVCDGFDNDCDGLVDEGCTGQCVAPRSWQTFSHGDPATTPDFPSFASGAHGLALVSRSQDPSSGPTLALRHLDRWGALRLGPIPFARGSAAGDVAIAKSGDWHGVAWLDDRAGNTEVWFARFKNSLTPGTERAVATGNATHADPAVTWAGTRWAAAWAEGRNTLQVEVAILNAEGFLTDQSTASSRAGSARRPALAFDGSALGVAWDDDRDGTRGVFFRMLDAFLDPLTDEIRIDDGTGTAIAPAVAWTGASWIVAWVDGPGEETVRVRALGPDGVPLAPSEALGADPGTATRPSLAFTGEEVLVALAEHGGGASTVYVARVDPTGAVLEDAVAVATTDTVTPVGVAWDGEAPRVSYLDPSGAVAVRSLRCCGDGDGDGADRCDDDCDDTDPARGPDAIETCNGIDDDCNGDVDDALEGCPRYCIDSDLLDAPEPNRGSDVTRMWDVSAAWDGGTFGVVWSEDADPSSTGGRVLFRRFTADGDPMGDPVILASRPVDDPTDPVIAAASDGWAVAWFREDPPQGPSFARLTADGTLAGAVVERNSVPAGENPAMVYDGRGFGLVWDGNGYARFARYSLEGTPIGPIESMTAREPELIWSGREYLLFSGNGAGEPSGIYLDRFDAEGRRLESRTRIATPPFAAAFEPDAAWIGDGFGLVFVDNHETVYFQRFAEDGTPWTSLRSIAYGDYVFRPEIVWTGETFLVQYAHDIPERMELVRVDRLGRRIGDVTVLSEGLPGSQWAFDRSGIAVGPDGRALSAFHRSYDPEAAVWTRIVGCCPDNDHDGDRSCMADCDDFDPATYPGAPEACDGVDNDCDGAVVGEGPFETVTGLGFEVPSTMSWSAVGDPSALYDVQRGSLDLLRANGGDYGPATESCLASDLASTTVSDPDVPVSGEAWFYLAAAGSDRCNGSFGGGGAGETGDRDGGLGASANACP